MSRTNQVRVLPFVVGTVALAALTTASTWTGPVAAAFWFWLAACLVGELMWVRLSVGRVTVSMASCFHFASLLSLPVGQAMLAAALSGVLAEAVFVRKPLIRALFNGAQAALSVGAASVTLTLLSRVHPPGQPIVDFGLPAMIAAAAIYALVNSGLVSLAVALHERIALAHAWRANFGTRYEALSNGALFSLGALLAGTAARQGIAGALLIILPLLIAFDGYRRYAGSRAVEESPSVAKAA